MQHEQHTPLIQQYFNIKEQYPDALLLFQVGDFYELFFDDAKNAAAFLGITLTARGKNKGEPIPLCGVPVSTLDHYVAKLVKGGFKVAICDQAEEARPGTVVRREVRSVLTPGTLIDSKLLDAKSASYLLTFVPIEDHWAVLVGELMTAQLFATMIPVDSEKLLESELSRYFPDEILLPETKSAHRFESFFKKCGYNPTFFSYSFEDEAEHRAVNGWIETQFSSNERNKIDSSRAMQMAIAYFYAYVRRNQVAALSLFTTIQWYRAEDYLFLDAATQRNLELIKNSHDGSMQYTLFSVLDNACTPMGSRMIKKWITRPLVEKEAIEQRHDVIEILVQAVEVQQLLKSKLSLLGDIERVVGRVVMDRANHQDYLALIPFLEILPQIKKSILEYAQVAPLLQLIYDHIKDFSSLNDILKRALHDDLQRDWIIKKGFNKQLDYLRDLVENSQQKMVDLEVEEQKKTGINSLKIRYHQVYGYTIEITKTNTHLVPAHYERIQTLVGKERYVMATLKQLHRDIELAETESAQMEAAIFAEIKKEILAQRTDLRRAAYAISYLDALLGIALTAYHNKYVRPQMTDARFLTITDGRHPIVEQSMDHSFIPNDTVLHDQNSTWIITGPNMGGKSTYLRQVALNALLAHIGSFVAARAATIPLLDRIFTRIGSGDHLAAGKSTFLVEMEETATICTLATKNSLVILDEVGRGTSTFDGLAIAQAVVEYITQRIGSYCLFATHYHELTHLKEQISSLSCYYAASKQVGDSILFLYKILPGVADGSFGIEVAKLAQLPAEIIDRSRLLVTSLSMNQSSFDMNHALESAIAGQMHAERKMQEYAKRCDLLMKKADLIDKIEQLDWESLSPKAAFDLLWEWKNKVQI